MQIGTIMVRDAFVPHLDRWAVDLGCSFPKNGVVVAIVGALMVVPDSKFRFGAQRKIHTIGTHIVVNSGGGCCVIGFDVILEGILPD